MGKAPYGKARPLRGGPLWGGAVLTGRLPLGLDGKAKGFLWKGGPAGKGPYGRERLWAGRGAPYGKAQAGPLREGKVEEVYRKGRSWSCVRAGPFLDLLPFKGPFPLTLRADRRLGAFTGRLLTRRPLTGRPFTGSHREGRRKGLREGCEKASIQEGNPSGEGPYGGLAGREPTRIGGEFHACVPQTKKGRFRGPFPLTRGPYGALTGRLLLRGPLTGAPLTDLREVLTSSFTKGGPYGKTPYGEGSLREG